MEISGPSGIGGSFQNEILRSAKSSTKTSEAVDQKEEAKKSVAPGQAQAADQGKNGIGKGLQSSPGQERLTYQRELAAQQGVSAPKNPPAPSAADKPVQVSAPPPVSSETQNTDLRSLATKYVDQYINYSGSSLSGSAKEELVQNVAAFYGSRDDGASRLAKIVF